MQCSCLLMKSKYLWCGLVHNSVFFPSLLRLCRRNSICWLKLQNDNSFVHFWGSVSFLVFKKYQRINWFVADFQAAIRESTNGSDVQHSLLKLLCGRWKQLRCVWAQSGAALLFKDSRCIQHLSCHLNGDISSTKDYKVFVCVCAQTHAHTSVTARSGVHGFSVFVLRGMQVNMHKI